jgi:hypothetical protein
LTTIAKAQRGELSRLERGKAMQSGDWIYTNLETGQKFLSKNMHPVKVAGETVYVHDKFIELDGSSAPKQAIHPQQLRCEAAKGRH